MEVLWVFLALLAVAAVAGLISSWVSGQRRLRRRVLDQFGKLPQGDGSLEGIPDYAASLGELSVDSATWEDLDMDRVFRRINACQSSVGEQVLYAQLHRLERMDHWEELLSHLERCPDERQRVWLILAKLGKRRVEGDLERLQGFVTLLWACRRLAKELTYVPLQREVEEALAVNAILGQSVDTCAAERYAFRPGKVLSSMAVRDDITAGESYFMAEVRSLKRLTDAARRGGCLLFIDEILKGTNTVERLAASQAVLEELHRRDCLCVAATHDRELTGRLAGSYHSFHFQERLTEDGVEFDYLLRPGPANTQNAIRLLELLGFSAPTVERAQQLAKRGETCT